MIHWLILTSLRFKLVVLALAAAVLVLGVQQARQMPVDAAPEFSPPIIEVQTEALGLSAPEVENLVTLNLEELLNGTPWLKSIHSRSVPGLSSIVLSFEPGTDVMRARQLVSERLTLAIAIPNVAQPSVILQPFSSANRVMMVGLSSTTVSPIEMGVLARWNVRPALLAVPGVANVAVWGQRERQLQVQIEPDKLEANNVSLDQVVKTTGNAMWVSPLTFLQASTLSAGGWVETPSQRLEVRHVFPISTAADLAKVTVDGAAPLQLHDVADVVQSHQPLIGDAVLGGGSSLLLVIEKFPNANTLQVTRGLDEALAKLQPGLSGIQIDTKVSRPATYIETSRDNLTTSLILGGVLLVAFLAAALWDWRAGVITILAVSVSLMAALLVLDVRGESINLLVVGGFAAALVVLVDDCVGACERGLARAPSRAAPDDETDASDLLVTMLEARRGAGYATLIALVPLAPIFFSDGVARALAEPMVLSYALAVVASLIVGVTVTPVLVAVLPSRSRDTDGRRALGRWIADRYRRLLDRVLRAPSPALVVCGATVVAACLLIPTFQQRILPSFRDPDLVVQWTGPVGTSEPETARLVAGVSRDVRAIPGVRDVGAHVGRAVLGDQIVDVNSAELWVNVDPSADYDATVAAIKAAAGGYPGVQAHVTSYLDDRVGHFDTGPQNDIVVRVFGPEFSRLHSTAAQVRQMLSGIDGVAGTTMQHDVTQPTVDIEVNLKRARAHGLKPGDVRRAASTMLAGLEVGSLFEQQKVFQVTVWSTPASRSNLTAIGNLQIDTPGGGRVRLGDVADISITATPTLIQRDEVSRRVDVGVDVKGRDPGAVTNEIRDRLAAMSFPLEFRAQVIPEYRSADDLHRRMAGAGLAAAVIIFLLLQAAFQSWRLASLVFLSLPFALAGGVIAVFVAGDALSLPSLLAFAPLLAIAARNGLRLVASYESSGGSESVATVSTQYVSSILLAAVGTALLLLPLIVTGTIAGQEDARPIAIIVLGGLITTTLHGTVLVPVMYGRFGTRRQAKHDPGRTAETKHRWRTDNA
jgi:Cu/Ag efflux pump CusA